MNYDIKTFRIWICLYPAVAASASCGHANADLACLHSANSSLCAAAWYNDDVDFKYFHTQTLINNTNFIFQIRFLMEVQFTKEVRIFSTYQFRPSHCGKCNRSFGPPAFTSYLRRRTECLAAAPAAAARDKKPPYSPRVKKPMALMSGIGGKNTSIWLEEMTPHII